MTSFASVPEDLPLPNERGKDTITPQRDTPHASAPEVPEGTSLVTTVGSLNALEASCTDELNTRNP